MFLIFINIDHFNFNFFKIFTLILIYFILFLIPIMLNFDSYKYFRIYI